MNQRIRGKPAQDLPKTFHYVYQINHEPSGAFYIGSRTSRVPPEQDLWVNYFTSSKRVKALIESDGRQVFVPEILRTEKSSEDAYWAEQRIIKAYIKTRGCLNKHYVDPESGSEKFSMAGVSRKLSDAEKKAIGDRKRGKKLGPHSEEHRRKISESNKGKNKGKIPSLEQLKAANAKRWFNPDARKKQAEVMRQVNAKRKMISES